MKERWASLISGGGTTMQEMVKACQTGEVSLDIACVISSTPSAGGIEKARKLGIPDTDIVVVNPDMFGGGHGRVDQERFGLALLRALKEHGVTVVTQNGWLPLTPSVVIDAYPNAMFNQHPGPVPEFGGKGMFGRRVHAAVLLFRRMTGRDFWTEAVAQRVHKKYDRGAVVRSSRVEIHPEDTVDDLQQRVLPIEHRTQIALLKDVVDGNVNEAPRIEGLIRPEEEQILLLAKRTARILYPHG
ncbi:MAG: formyltransferase family protein [bacterium]|nr:formyltransferase family protein [bacterium]